MLLRKKKRFGSPSQEATRWWSNAFRKKIEHNEALSNYDLDYLLSSSPSYSGTFPLDKLPPIPSTHASSSIINYHRDDQPGSHWCCYYNHPDEAFVSWFDSYGLPPSDRIKRWLRKTSKPILYSTSRIQNITSNRCGYYCMYFIQARDAQLNPYDILYQFYPDGSMNNERKLIDLLF